MTTAVRHRTPGVRATQLGDVIPLVDLLTRAPEQDRTIHRDDPVYSQLGNGPSNAQWEDKRSIKDAPAATGRKVTDVMRRMTATVDPKTLWYRERTGAQARRAAGAIFGWRTLSSDQVAAFTGDDCWRGMHRGRVPVCGQNLVAGGALETGTVARVPSFKPPTIVRPGGLTLWPKLGAELTVADWFAMTGGAFPRLGAMPTMHNLVTAELALRVSEFCEVAGVAGELLSSHEQLVPQASQLHSRRAAAADMTIIRTDGAKLAVEVTRNAGNIADKVRRWIQVLALDTSNSVRVLFVWAPHLRPSAERTALHAQQAIHDALWGDPNAVRLGLHRKFSWVNWRDWFPSAGTALQEFAQLPALGVPREPGGSWRRQNLLDPTGKVWVPPTREDERDAEVGRTLLHLLDAQPHWLREQTQADRARGWFDEALVRQVGFDRLPHVTQE